MKLFLFLFGLCFFFSELSGAFVLPTGLNQEGKSLVVDVLGFGTLSKVNSNPHPLGGYTGVEWGLSQESISSSKLGTLGEDPSSAGYFNSSHLTFGKGFYSNWDIFLSFAPFGQQIQSQLYGGMLRWCFWNTPLYRFSITFHGNGANIQNKFFSEGSGMDLISAITWKNFDFYVGGGPSTVAARFAPALLAPNQNAYLTATTMRTFAGLTYEWDKYFVAMEYHRIRESTYALKLGFRL